jgi:hypothetical protein
MRSPVGGEVHDSTIANTSVVHSARNAIAPSRHTSLTAHSR